MIYSLQDLKELMPGDWQNFNDLSYTLSNSQSAKNGKGLRMIYYLTRQNKFNVYQFVENKWITTNDMEMVLAYYKQHFKFLNFK